MFNDLYTLVEHMEEKHPGSKTFGDTVSVGLDGRVISQVCFVCGEELVQEVTLETTEGKELTGDG